MLVIPEDCHKDQHVLLPLVRRLVEEVANQPKVKVCTDPRLRGVAQAMDWSRYIQPIVEKYRGMIDLFLLIVDRDGKTSRRDALDHLEAQARAHLNPMGRSFIACHAIEEVEVWVLAGMNDLPKDWAWADIRSERDPKETWYAPYAESRGLASAPLGGRKVLAARAAANYKRVRRLCPEVEELEKRIRECLENE